MHFLGIHRRWFISAHNSHDYEHNRRVEFIEYMKVEANGIDDFLLK